MSTAARKFPVLSIDTYDGKDGDWTRRPDRAAINVGEYDEAVHGTLSKSAALDFFYENYLNRAFEKSRFHIDDDGDRLICCTSSDNRPLFTIEVTV